MGIFEVAGFTRFVATPDPHQCAVGSEVKNTVGAVAIDEEKIRLVVLKS